MNRTTAVAILALFSLAGRAHADEAVWKQVWSDEFDRAELGSQWRVVNGAARIADGRMFLTGGGGTVLIDRPFASDVRIEFTAEANPDDSPCDLSVAMGANRLWGYYYLLAFGGQNNRANQIVGGPGVRDSDPPFLIEHGKTYAMQATKEGSKLTYVVNGTKILEMTHDDVVGGPGLDLVGLVTWNGMYVDHVKVFERTPPAPDGPAIIPGLPDLGYRWSERRLTCPASASEKIRQAADAYNRRAYDEALKILDTAEGDRDAFIVRGYLLGDVGYEMSETDRARFAQAARAIRGDAAADGKTKDFALAAEWFSRLTVVSRDRVAAIRLAGLGERNNPFYHKAMLFQARYLHAAGLEGANRPRIEQSVAMFRELLAIWPEHGGLRELTGERVAWGPELTRPESDGPAWARHLQEAFARHQAVLNWWFTKRQAPDGQLGGGWGDDVEILRGWVPAACISSACEPAIAGIERLADGVWTYEMRDGYSPDRGDVEHSAEPSADSQPTMMFLRYGDPLWVERNLRSAKTIREQFMAINRRGRLQFISAEFGTDGVRTEPVAGGDTGYHARAMKHFIWLAWQGNPEAKQVFLDWCETWREATMTQIGTKPVGFIPASIFYPSGGIDPPNGKPWYDDRSHYYGFAGLPDMVMESLLTAYALSGEIKFLDAVQTVMDLSATGPLRQRNPALPPDHIDNLLAHVAHECGPKVLSVYRWLVNDRTYDDYLIKLADTARHRYLAGGTLSDYMASFDGLANRLRYNWAQRTSEVLQTDRAGLEGAAEVMGAYTGAVRDLRDAATPTFAVTWDAPDLNFAAVVTEATPRRLRIWTYNFNAEPMTVGLRPWQLVPGAYALRCGAVTKGERPGQYRYAWAAAKDLRHYCRADPIAVEIPSHTEWVIDLRLREPIERPAVMADLAIMPRDIRREADRVTATVHNIGGTAAGAFAVTLEAFGEQGWKQLGRQSLDGLPAIKNFEPVRREIVFPVKHIQTDTRLRVLVDPVNDVQELYEFNNSAEIGG